MISSLVINSPSSLFELRTIRSGPSGVGFKKVIFSIRDRYDSYCIYFL